jgi:hypothetical protein
MIWIWIMNKKLFFFQLGPKKDGLTRCLKFTWIGRLLSNNFPKYFDSKLYIVTKEHKNIQHGAEVNSFIIMIKVYKNNMI